MKKLAIFFAISAFCISCNISNDFSAEEYPIGGNKYVILIRSNGSYSDNHHEAVKRAVRLARDNGFRYFKILNGIEVDVLQSGEIVDRHFAEENLNEGLFEEEDLEPAYQLTVRYYKKRPFFGQVIDTCRYCRQYQMAR